MIIMFAHERGGVGKSTLAYNFAYFAASDSPKLRVVLVDADESGVTTRWWNARKRIGLKTDFDFANFEHSNTTNILNLSEQYDLVIVDVGAANCSLIEMARIADLWIAPTVVSDQAMCINVNMLEEARSTKSKRTNGKIPLVFAFNKTPTVWNSTEAVTSQKVLREYAPDIKVLDSMISERRVYRDADREGKSIFEMPLRQRTTAVAEFFNFARQAFRAQKDFMKEAANGN